MHILFLILILSTSAFASINHGLFSGRVSRINSAAKLMRVRTTFKNMKFLNENDTTEFYNQSYPMNRCLAIVKAKSNDYVLFHIPNYKNCVSKVMISTGSHLFFESERLVKNIKMAEELVNILLKKRMALKAREERLKGELEVHATKVEAVNTRYETLRQKLEIEWDNEVLKIEEEKSKNFTEYKATEARLNDVDQKLEKYRVHDQNLLTDRWSLDPALYYKK